MADAMVDCTERMLEGWERPAAAGETIDVVADMMALTQAIIVRTMFSTDLGMTAGIVNRTWPIINRRIDLAWSFVGMRSVGERQTLRCLQLS
jgi:cytochrome P450